MADLRLVHSDGTPYSRSSKPPPTSASCPYEQPNGVLDCPHLPSISDTTQIAGKLQWCALNHPHILGVFEDMIDKLIAQSAGSAMREGVTLVLLSGALLTSL